MKIKVLFGFKETELHKSSYELGFDLAQQIPFKTFYLIWHLKRIYDAEY